MNITDATVYIAPVGTDPTDAGAWMSVGFADDVQFEESCELDAPEHWFTTPRSVSITVPLRAIRHVLPPLSVACEHTLSAIQQHARRTRVARALAAARAAGVLPCPLPFSGRATHVYR
ncbi:hypothetical protein KUF83_29985 [Streptomyces sp. BV286]|uniref:hypothetical protein n=1 Tax=Streptomyces sp. BV286 TaxID=2849672 RepID=UPI001C2E7DBB|nr:hypothetical protein [Streptomyces sp. BV286]MBV1940766.1 hypothetical protein [Streptomyces sp. BV286]